MDNNLVKKKFTLKYIAEFINGTVKGDELDEISRISPIDDASNDAITFIDNPKYISYLNDTKAKAVILKPELQFKARKDLNLILSNNPYLSYAKLSSLFVKNNNTSSKLHPLAVIGTNTKLGSNIFLGAHVTIGDNCKISDNVIIHSGVSIGDNVSIDNNSEIFPKVVIYDNVKIGSHCIIHSGVVIGADGFGFAKDGEKWFKIHQLGSVEIGSNVEIGANTTVDCGALGNTIIKDGVKLDNQIQIGHNVIIGENSILAGCTAVAGSTKIGSNCMIGGCCMISGHIEITSNVILTAGSGVANSILTPGIYSSGAGSVMPTGEWRRNVIRFKQLDKLAKKVTQLNNLVNKNSNKITELT